MLVALLAHHPDARDHDGGQHRRSGGRPTRWGLLAGLLAFGDLAFLGLALSLVFSVANVFFRDFGKVTQTLTQFVTFSVPMIYPYSLVEERFASIAPWLADGLPAEPARGGGAADAAVLLGRDQQRPRGRAALEHLPPDLYARGLVMLLISVVTLVLAQMWFSKFERRVPERL